MEYLDPELEAAFEDAIAVAGKLKTWMEGIGITPTADSLVHMTELVMVRAATEKLAIP